MATCVCGRYDICYDTLFCCVCGETSQGGPCSACDELGRATPELVARRATKRAIDAWYSCGSSDREILLSWANALAELAEDDNLTGGIRYMALVTAVACRAMAQDLYEASACGDYRNA